MTKIDKKMFDVMFACLTVTVDKLVMKKASMGTKIENTIQVCRKWKRYNENVKCTPSKYGCITLISYSIQCSNNKIYTRK